MRTMSHTVLARLPLALGNGRGGQLMMVTQMR